MAGLIETWRRLITVPERSEQSVRSDRRAAAAKREAQVQGKTSAERAIERLAERTDTSCLEGQSLGNSKASVPEQGKQIGGIQKEGKDALLQMAAAKELSMITSEEIRKIVEEALCDAKDTEEIKEYLEQRFSIIEGQILSVRNVQKQEMIAGAVREVREKVDLIRLDTRRMGSIKIMLGVSIWFNLVSLAVLVAYILNFI